MAGSHQDIQILVGELVGEKWGVARGGQWTEMIAIEKGWVPT